MRKDSRSRDPQTDTSLPSRLLAMVGRLVAGNPIAIGGATAFLVTFSFVSANALFYQPFPHPAAFFPTRDLQFTPRQESTLEFAEVPVPETRIRFEREDAAPADPAVQEVQQILADLNLYSGMVDGINGPRTMEAIADYRRIVGLPDGGIDAELLLQLGAKREPAAIEAPLPKSRPETHASVQEQPAAAEAAPALGAAVVRIQAGLRAFGNDHIEVDGIAGGQTAAAIREFQSLFGLEVDGKASEEVLAKMRELGLAD